MSSESQAGKVEEKSSAKGSCLKEKNDDDHPRRKNNDLIIDEGFPAFNTFHSKKNDDEKDILPQFKFASFSSALTMNQEQKDNITHDCNLAFTARTKEDSDAYSTGATFFVPAAMKPRCALEKLALQIFKSHTHSLIPEKHYDLERSGAEWWTLVLDCAPEKDDNNHDEDDNEDEEEDDEVGMHFDADYGLEEQLPNYMLHPRVATVTYLSDAGVPTFIMDKRSPPPTDTEKKSLNGFVNKSWISCPMMGKHVSFDGRLLHGAIGTFHPKTSTPKEDEDRGSKRRKVGDDGKAYDTTEQQLKRITFMVNIWINHCPIDAEMIDDELCSQMKTQWPEDTKGNSSEAKTIYWSLQSADKPNKLPVKEVRVGKGESEKVTETIESVICDREVAINFRSSEATLNDISQIAHDSEGKSIEVQFDDTLVEIEVGDIVPDSDNEDSQE